jgi:signal transduction histidine kinase
MKDNDIKHIYDISAFNISDLDFLLHEILKYTRDSLQAEAGTIYIKNGDHLDFHVFQNDVLSYENIYKFNHSTKDNKLSIFEDKKFISVSSFLSRKIIIVDDVYKSDSFEFEGVKNFDANYNYRTHSLICIPLIHPIERVVLGVVQLINKKINGEYSTFNTKDKEDLTMFSSFISLSILRAQDNMEKLRTLNKELEETNKKLEQNVKQEKEDNKEMSSIIYHQSKMASMGEMIGNIANLWRQPLNTISAIASGISLEIQHTGINKTSVIGQLERIVSTTKILTRTVNDFRNFYNVDNMHKEFNLSSAINKSLDISKNVMQLNNIEIIATLDASIVVYALENEFIQSFLNLITNSEDALIVNINMAHKRYIFIDLFKEDNKINIKIKDNAKGIEKKIEDDIFNEYFSTKKSSENIGLGLFLTKQIIEKHMNGCLNFKNSSYEYEGNEYYGAEFTITLG